MNTLLNNLIKQTNFSETENGAKTYKSTLSPVLDFFALGAAMRHRSDQDIIALFSKALATDKLLALKILFYFRDIRGGQGERKVFRTIINWLGNEYPSLIIKNLQLIKEFGRWDDILSLEGTKAWNNVLVLIKNEFFTYLKEGRASLLFKWLPSSNCSSKTRKQLAKSIIKFLNISEKKYRKTLSKARSELKIVEKDMCAKEWSNINYSHVPSKASLLYKDAFIRHDKERYEQFISDVKSGKAKINASVTYPYEIVERILYKEDKSETLDVIWSSLPNYLENNPHNGIVVADVSGSMAGTPMAVSISLALYFAERNNGFFHNAFITFSEQPSLQKVIGNNIREKVNNLSMADWGMSTNLQSVFDLILNTAKSSNIPQEDMPSTIYIVSDMEFNYCSNNSCTNYEAIKSKYEEAGYKKPNLIFWNVNAKGNHHPITHDENGTCLVSGCSPSILEGLLAGEEISAEDAMLEILNKERYSSIAA